MSTASEAAAKAMGRKRALAVYAVVLQVAGLLLSVQLLANHFTSSRPAMCEMGRYVSCAAVQNSAWAFVFGVPVAFFGVVFFLLGLGMAVFLASPREDDAEVAAAFAVLQGLGLLSVGYLVAGEVALGALCPLCTAVHAAILASLWLSLRVVRLRNPRFRPSPAGMLRLAWAVRTWVLVAVLLAGTPLLAAHLLREPDRLYSDAQLVAFGKCLATQRVTFFSKADCSVCARQRELLGPATAHFPVVECGEETREQCKAHKVWAFPSWLRRSTSAYVRDSLATGLRSIPDIAELSGCKIEPE